MRLAYLSRLAPYLEADPGTPSGGPAIEPLTGNDPAKTDDKRFSQADLDAAIKDRLERERKKTEREKLEAEAKAKESALAEQGEFKTLAEQRATEIASLKAQVEDGQKAHKLIDRYTDVLSKTLAAQLSQLPDPIKDLLSKHDPADALEWLAANLDKVSNLKPVSGLPALGTPKRDNAKPLTPTIQLPERKYTL